MDYVKPVMYHEKDAKQVVVTTNEKVPVHFKNQETAPIRLYHEQEKPTAQNAAAQNSAAIATNGRSTAARSVMAWF